MIIPRNSQMSNVMLTPPSPKNDAVSPVIGTILLVALTLILVSIVAVVLMGFNAGEPAPILGISIGHEGNIITMTHLNGAVLPAGTYKILVDGVEKDFGATGIFSPGMTLRWDSGTEKVGTVSVVYTDTSGKSTVLVQKTIGKAGSGVISNPKILSAAGQTFLISDAVWGGEWQDIRNQANASSSSITLPNYKVYCDGESYWWAITSSGVPPYTLNKAEAETISNITLFTKLPYHDEWIKINTSRVLTPEDGTPYTYSGGGIEFSTTIVKGTLFCKDSILYVLDHSTGTTRFEREATSGTGWKIIGTLYSP